MHDIATRLLEPRSIDGTGKNRKWVSLALCLSGAALLLVSIPIQQSTSLFPKATTSLPHPVDLTSTKDHVRVDLFGMAGCPFTRAFVESVMSETLTVASGIIDFHFHPFGNCFTATPQCGGSSKGNSFTKNAGYKMSVRKCWDSLCGAAAKEPTSNCFTGDFLCQHGEAERLVTASWACAKSLGEANTSVYWPYVRCTALGYDKVTGKHALEQLVRECGNLSGLNSESILSCVSSPRGRQLLTNEARETVPHPTVPFVLVEGAVLKDTHCATCAGGLLRTVCELVQSRSLLAKGSVCDGLLEPIPLDAP